MLVHAALLRTLPIGCSMHNLLRCRRGTAAFATVVALVPLIGVVALGAEGGSWYVTKQHAQNAADAAAYSGALKLACDNAAPCADTQVTWTIAASNLRHRTRSATRATPPPIPAASVRLAFRQEPRRPSRSIRSLHGTGSTEISFRRLLASNSQRTWQKCLVCPPST